MTVAEVASVEALGGYWRLVLAGDGLGAARPGQFLAVATGGPDSAQVTARVFSVHDADPGAGTASLVIAVVGPGTAWLAGRRPGDEVPVTGPLGNGFTLPGGGAAWLGVGGGYGCAPLAWAAREVTARGGVAGVIAGAASVARLCDVTGMRRAAGERLWLTTDDGSAGVPGRVTAVMAAAVRELGRRRAGAEAPGTALTIGGCGPMAMLGAVWREADRLLGSRVLVEVAVEEQMACGIGVCMTCVLPVVGADGVTRMSRSCTTGPVLDASRVRWDALTLHGSVVPDDAWGAPMAVAR